MIKFFRKIRQKLLSENKFSKYLIYAIGEVILVVIGILIALQINNWNEEKKSSKIELELLKNLNRDLDIDIVNFESKIRVDSSIMVSNKNLLIAFKNKDKERIINSRNAASSIATSLSTINRTDIFYPQKSAYESLKSQGIQIIKNSSLRQNIVNLYDFRYQTVSDFLKFQWEGINQTNPYLIEHLETNIDDFNKTPNDIEKLINDKKFYNFLSQVYYENNVALEYYKPCLEDLKTTSKALKKEIRRLEK
mgnify:CR=1 FL=1